MKIKYFGHSAFMIEGKGIKALIDPFISENPLNNENIEDLSGITHIFITHGHGDHLGDTIEIAKKNNSKIITNFEIGQYLLSNNLSVHTMHIGGRYEFDFGIVKMTPALHGSGIYNGEFYICGGNPCGFIIELEGKKIYHAGDTGLTIDMKLLEDENIYLALIPIGGNYTMDINDAIKAVDFIRPKITVPMHYNTFPLIEADPEKFRQRVRNSVVRVLSAGEIMEI